MRLLRVTRHVWTTPAVQEENLTFQRAGSGAAMYTAFECGRLSSEPKCNTPADLIIGIVDQDLRECCNAMLFAFVG